MKTLMVLIKIIRYSALVAMVVVAAGVSAPEIAEARTPADTGELYSQKWADKNVADIAKETRLAKRTQKRLKNKLKTERLSVSERRKIRRNIKKLKKKLRKLRAEKMELLQLRKSIAYVNGRNAATPYPTIDPCETKESADKKFADYIRTLLFRIGNLERAIESAREVGGQGGAVLRDLLRRKAMYDDVLKQARADRAAIQGMVLPAPHCTEEDIERAVGGIDEDVADDEEAVIEISYNPTNSYFYELVPGVNRFKLTSMERTTVSIDVMVINEITGEADEYQLTKNEGGSFWFEVEVPVGDIATGLYITPSA